MSTPLDVAAIVGSLRRDSYTRRLTAYSGCVNELFDAEGEFVNTATRELCVKFVRSFETWVRRIAGR